VNALAVLVDGVPLGDDEARAFWARFSAHMEAHKGDLAGFARSEGFASVHPRMEGGRAVLIVSRTEGQRPYATASTLDQKGSDGRQAIQKRRKKPLKSDRKRQ
jgi:hypothetical protein